MCITKPAIRNSEKPITKQLLQIKNRLRTVQSIFLSLFSSEDEEMEDSIIVRDNSSYEMRDVLPPDQNKQV